MDPTFSIFNYSSHRFDDIKGRQEATCEEICINFAANRIGIKPLARFIFGLRVHQKTGIKWIPNNETLDPTLKYEFRVRFYVPRPTITLKKIDIVSYKYFYNQIRYDLLHCKIDDIKYPKHKDSVLGLSAVMMYIDHIENKYTEEDLRANYRKYLPKQLAKNHPYFAKQRIFTPVSEMLKKPYDIYYVLKIYIDAILKMAPNYMLETYDCDTECIPEDGTQQKLCPVKAQVNFNYESQPGLWIYYQYMDEWKHIALDGIYAIVCENDIVELQLAGQAKTIRLRFRNKKNNETSDMASFVTCIAGYYRLSVRWMQDICYKYPTPSLAELKSLKCHGPIGADYSYALIKEKYNKCGAYILRQCENEYESFRLDIMRGMQIDTIPIKRSNQTNGMVKWSYNPGDISDSNRKEYNSISELINSIDSKGEKFCIHPSEYDNSPLLLICVADKPLKVNKIVTEFNDIELETKGRIFDFYSDLQLYVLPERKLENGKISEMLADWILPGERHLKVIVKICIDSNCGDFLKLSSDWSKMHAQELMKLHGVTLCNPLTMVLEYAPHGDLQQLLQKVNSMPIRCLMEAVYNLVRAVIYLQEKGFIHSKIRCSNLFVTKYEPKNNVLMTKLGDPGLSRCYGIDDFPWIPIEYEGRLEKAKLDRTTQHWAFATTVWEIFNRGANLNNATIDQIKENYRTRKLILPINGEIPSQIRNIISEGWSEQEEKHKRFDTQLIFSRLAIIMIDDYQFLYNSSMSSTTSMCTLSESSNTSYHNDTCSSSRTSSTCSLHHEPSYNDNHSDFLFKKFDLQRYVQELEFGKLTYFEKIGQGHYGTVRKGEIQFYDTNKPSCKVAIKTLNDTREIRPSEVEDFRREIDIMKKLDHKNIVKIISSLFRPQITIIMEYIESNSFLVFLKTNKDLKDRRLLKFALDVAEGMNYLRGMNIIHRDLAARNILIDNCAKISDFGLARTADSYGIYKVQTKEREFPIAWYSPETIESETFSFHSDVWSYGITLFEMFSRGESPHLNGKELPPVELLDKLNKGERLQKPEHCHLKIYHELLIPCWKAEPKSRPNFEQIISKIMEIMEDPSFH